MVLSTLAGGTRLSSKIHVPTQALIMVRFFQTSNPALGFFSGRELGDGKLDVKDFPPKYRVQLPGNPKGHFAYDRNISKLHEFKYQIPGDTVFRFIFGRFWEMKPLWGLYFSIFVLIPVLVLYEAWFSFNKIEIAVARHNYGFDAPNLKENSTPFDWDKVRDNYWKKPMDIWHFWNGEKDKRARLPEMEMLQDAMFEEALKRHTYKTVRFQEGGAAKADHH